MAPIGKLYTYPNNPRAAKALIAARYNGVELELPSFQMGVTNKTPQFLEKFPFGKVPALETADGAYIYESNAIQFYVAESKKDTQLLGKTPVERALVQTFVNISINEITPAASTWIFPLLGIVPHSQQNEDKAKEDIHRALKALDHVLLDKTYLVGESVTLADINVALALLNLFRLVLDSAARSQYVNVSRWFTTIVNQPHFKAIIGDVQLATSVAIYKVGSPVILPSGPAPATASSSGSDSKKDNKEEKKGKKEEKKKEEPKKEEPKKEEEEEEEENYEEPKGKNPLDNLPPSKFSLETWKRFYSNNEEEKAIEYFWENYDSEGFSLFRYDYVDNPITDKRVFMTSNLIGGFFQRVEDVRKYGFSSTGIFGDDTKNEVHGFWVFRGPEVPAEITDAPDYESYKFTKLDHTDKKNREIVNALLAWKEIPGIAAFNDLTSLPFNSGKIFK